MSQSFLGKTEKVTDGYKVSSRLSNLNLYYSKLCSCIHTTVNYIAVYSYAYELARGSIIIIYGIKCLQLSTL